MKCKIPEISWHNRDPVLSVDLQTKLELNKDVVQVYRLASGGTDAHVLIWYLELNTETGDVEIELAADLSRHQRAVNAVKWSPNGELLASGDDESVIFIWKQKSETETLNLLENTNEEDKEIWLTMKILRGHMEDVYDLCWAPNSKLLVSGSVDNTAMIWDVHKGKSLAILNDHKGFVQGVTWDPCNKYIATLSTDRYLRIFDIQTRKVLHRINKSILPVPEGHELYEKNCRLFHDDTLQTFFRRLTFTPDGKLLITPAGLAEYADVTHHMETSYIFSRYELKQPAIVLPSPEQYTVAVRCCPILFKLRQHSAENPPVVPLPYRMIFAVATRCSVYFYDTQQSPPFAVISNIHYTRLTDVTWSADGRVVVVSSTDGFCSLISFNEDELGEIYEKSVADLLAEEQVLQNNNNQANKKKSNKNRVANEQKSTPQKSATQKAQEKENNVDFILDKEIISSAEKFETPAKKTETATPIAVRRHPRTPAELLASAKVIEKLEEPMLEDDDPREQFVNKRLLKMNFGVEEEIISDDDEIRSEAEEEALMRRQQMEVEENEAAKKVKKEQMQAAKEKENESVKDIKEICADKAVNEVSEQKTIEEIKKIENKSKEEEEEEQMEVEENMAAKEKHNESAKEKPDKKTEKTRKVDENVATEKKDDATEKKEVTEEKQENLEEKAVNEVANEKTAGENQAVKTEKNEQSRAEQMYVEENVAEEKEVVEQKKENVEAEERQLEVEKEKQEEASEKSEKTMASEDKQDSNENAKENGQSRAEQMEIEEIVATEENELAKETKENAKENKDETAKDNEAEASQLEVEKEKHEATSEKTMASEVLKEKENKQDSNENAEKSVQSENAQTDTLQNQQPISADKNINVSPLPRPNYVSPSQRTPRRVALRTISTPKSKKKLLD